MLSICGSIGRDGGWGACSGGEEEARRMMKTCSCVSK